MSVIASRERCLTAFMRVVSVCDHDLHYHILIDMKVDVFLVLLLELMTTQFECASSVVTMPGNSERV